MVSEAFWANPGLLHDFQTFNDPASECFAQSSDADGRLSRFRLYVNRGSSRKARSARRGTALPADVRRFLLSLRLHRSVGFVPPDGRGLRSVSPRRVWISSAAGREGNTQAR